MTNFRLFQTERVCRRQVQIWQKWQKVIQTGRKHWEKEKLLITSNFSFSHSVLKRLVFQGRQKVSLCGNGLKCRLQFVSIWTSVKFCGLVMSWEFDTGLPGFSYFLPHHPVRSISGHFEIRIYYSEFDLLSYLKLINPLLKDKILDRSKFKALADNKINVTKKMKFNLGMVENILG